MSNSFTALLITITGVTATLMMTIYVKTISGIKDKRIRVVRLLGALLCRQVGVNGTIYQTEKTILIGGLVHYAIGIGFAAVYYYLWMQSWVTTLFDFFVAGILNGIIAMVVWRIFIMVQREKPAIPLSLFLITIGSAHLVFALAVYACFSLFGGLI